MLSLLQLTRWVNLTIYVSVLEHFLLLFTSMEPSRLLNQLFAVCYYHSMSAKHSSSTHVSQFHTCHLLVSSPLYGLTDCVWICQIWSSCKRYVVPFSWSLPSENSIGLAWIFSNEIDDEKVYRAVCKTSRSVSWALGSFPRGATTVHSATLYCIFSEWKGNDQQKKGVLLSSLNADTKL